MHRQIYYSRGEIKYNDLAVEERKEVAWLVYI